MAPDRGASSGLSPGNDAGGPPGYVDSADDEASSTTTPDPSSPTDRGPTRRRGLLRRTSSAQAYLATRATAPQNFTVRGVVAGLLIGTIICFSNMYFGLQTGWVSGMTMPASLMGFAVFKALSPHLGMAFTPVENVLIQTVAGAVGTMPLGSGFVGVIPAIEFLLEPGDDDVGVGGRVRLGWWKLVVWSLGLCFFGVVFAVPLRKEVIIREKLKFPSGTATALMIGVLHGEEVIREDDDEEVVVDEGAGGPEGVRRRRGRRGTQQMDDDGGNTSARVEEEPDGKETDTWAAKIRLLLLSFLISGLYTLTTYFVPALRRLPLLGAPLATTWLWALNPSPAYIGQGIIMGPATTAHMLVGAVLGWGVLSPLAKSKGWAPGPVADWETGSKGWIVWVSLAIMLADSVVSLGWLVLRPGIKYGRVYAARARYTIPRYLSSFSFRFFAKHQDEHTPLLADHTNRSPSRSPSPSPSSSSSLASLDAPDSELISPRTTLLLLILSLALCTLSIHFTFPSLLPPPLLLLALALALLLSLMGVRALGETDLNPVSGISKLTQLIFALVPSSAASPNAVLINLVAGAVSESGALQAGDMLQDLKTGHLLGASPRAQFWGQMIGSAVGAVVSVGVYRLYTGVYEVPGELFQVPTGYVWVFTARLVTGKGLPEGVWGFGVVAGGVWSVITAVRIWGRERKGKWVDWVPGGIAVAVGMYNVPSFTLARAIGGGVSWWWGRYCREGGGAKGDETRLIVLASGLILGEGVVSIVNLVLASLKVPHL